jgi:hypothetical protein
MYVRTDELLAKRDFQDVPNVRNVHGNNTIKLRTHTTSRYNLLLRLTNRLRKIIFRNTKSIWRPLQIGALDDRPAGALLKLVLFKEYFKIHIYLLVIHDHLPISDNI